MTTVRFLNGSHNIEGNIASIYTRTARVIIDFGMVGGYKEDNVKSLMKSHLLPNLPDLFTSKESKYQQQAIVLTQSDMENLTAAVYLNTDIKIYVSKNAFRLYQVLMENNLIQLIHANIKPLPTKLEVGDLTVAGFPSDCGIMGSQSLLISDGSHNFGVCGDVRLNGPHKDDVYTWIRKFHQKRLNLFLFDSTSFSFSNQCQLFKTDENALQNQFSDLVKQRRDLIVINVDAINVDRLKRMIKKGHHLGRKVVVEESFAKVIAEFYPSAKFAVLQESIRNKKTTPNKFEVVLLSDIKVNPNKYILQNSFGNINFLKELDTELYLHSNGFPKISEQSFTRLQRILMQLFHRLS